MSQGDLGTLVAAETSGADLAARLRTWRDALHTQHSGSSRPSYLQGGGEWLDTSVTPWVKKLWTGTVDVDLMSIDPATGTTQSLVGLQEKAGQYVYIAGGQIVADERILRANGATLNRADFPYLFAKAQARGLAASEGAKTAAQFGPGNGSTTFTLPDVRGYFLRNFDDGRGIDVGRVLSAIQQHAMPAHQHVTPIGFEVGGGAFSVYYSFAGSVPEFGSDIVTNFRQASSVTQSTPSASTRRAYTGQPINQSGETRPINLAAVLGITY